MLEESPRPIPPQSWLRQAQPLRRSRERQLFSHRYETLKLPQRKIHLYQKGIVMDLK